MQHSTYLLTTALTTKQLTQIGYKQSLIRFTLLKTNEYFIAHYDHHIQRSNEDTFLNDDKFANQQLTEKFFIKSPYVFTLYTLDKKYDHVISAALRDIQEYVSYFNKFNNFSLTFHFLTPKECDLHWSHEIMLRAKQAHAYTNNKFIQYHYTHNTPARQIHHRYHYINCKYTSSFFLNFTYCIKDTNLEGILRIYDPITQMYIFCSLTKTFNVDESHPPPPPTNRPTRIPTAR